MTTRYNHIYDNGYGYQGSESIPLESQDYRGPHHHGGGGSASSGYDDYGNGYGYGGYGANNGYRGYDYGKAWDSYYHGPIAPTSSDNAGVGIAVADTSSHQMGSKSPQPFFEEPQGPPPPQVPLSQERPTVRGGSLWASGRWKKWPFFVWLMSIIQICVFIAELAKMGEYTGSPIETKPTFNPMIGPSPYVMINMGARFTPCMHAIDGVTDDSSILFPCPNSTDVDTNVCSLSQLCGMGGIKEGTEPHQWWRFITPIFLHAGFIHIGFNLLLQLKLGADLERDIGIPRFFLVYFASGISGFVLGGNFTPDGIASTGASGSLFGVIALDLLDLLFNWQLYEHPVRALLLHIAEIIISFVIGLLPGLDNFSHIGGFAMGLLVGTAILRSPLIIRGKLVEVTTPDGASKRVSLIQSRTTGQRTKLQVEPIHWKSPHKMFVGRSKGWYGWLCVRIAAIVLAIVYFVTLIKNFENGGGNCSWCKYLSCLPVHGWCDQGEITTSSTTN
uniref:Rhomboid-type serine protease n=1 Tax=Blastobotrys adeninivorans TaxID=409370 RepID=A0A060T728_BLAAD